MIKHIKIAFLMFCFALALLVWGGWHYARYVQSLSRGNYFFEKTRNIKSVHTFVLKKANQPSLTLVQKDNLWRVHEADDYYVDFAKINAFIKLINNTQIFRADPIHQSAEAKGTEDLVIRSFDENGKVIDEATIMTKRPQNKFYEAKLNNLPYIYQIIGNFDVSVAAMDWIKMPLIAIPYAEVQQVVANEYTAYRRFRTEELRSKQQNNSPQIHALFQQLWYLSAVDVKNANHIDMQKFNELQKYQITTFDGLVYVLSVLHNDKEGYWLTINCEQEKIVSQNAILKLKENRLFYENWLFKIDDNSGRFLAGFEL
ncbi:MAG: hypothetical protein IJ864_04870 [Alphaproteobacteria bacterium]|nr:hypothetical protein [Alphaproteobacteria bacterium]